MTVTHIGRLLILALLPLALLPGMAITLTFPEEVKVRGEKVLLGDIATIDGTDEERSTLQAVVLDSSPLIGKRRQLSMGIIRVQLRHAGFNPNAIVIHGPSTIAITRASTEVDGPSLVAIAQEWLQAEMPAAVGEEVVLTPLRTPNTLTLPDGALTWTCSTTGSSAGAMRYIMLEMKVDGKPAWRGMISFQVQRLASVLVAKGAIPRGAIMDDTKVAVEKRDISSLTMTPVRDIADIAGHRAATAISAGAILTTDRMEVIPMVKRNDRARVSATCGAVTVTLVVVACEDGIEGATIRVRNTQSRDEFTARVVGPGELALDL